MQLFSTNVASGTVHNGEVMYLNKEEQFPERDVIKDVLCK